MLVLILAANYASIRVLKSLEGQKLRNDHFGAVKILRDELDRAGIGYKKPERPSHVTAVELGSAKTADMVMERMNNRGYYVQGKEQQYSVIVSKQMFSYQTSYRCNGRRNVAFDCIAEALGAPKNNFSICQQSLSSSCSSSLEFKTASKAPLFGPRTPIYRRLDSLIQ